eukprot:6841749-Alexandrium_andersonii.AAC.1
MRAHTHTRVHAPRVRARTQNELAPTHACAKRHARSRGPQAIQNITEQTRTRASALMGNCSAPDVGHGYTTCCLLYTSPSPRD